MLRTRLPATLIVVSLLLLSFTTPAAAQAGRTPSTALTWPGALLGDLWIGIVELFTEPPPTAPEAEGSDGLTALFAREGSDMDPNGTTETGFAGDDPDTPLLSGTAAPTS